MTQALVTAKSPVISMGHVVELRNLRLSFGEKRGKQMDFLRGLSVETEIRPGHAVDGICAAASEPAVDLVVTSTHGRTGLKHALIGSVAEHVVRYAERPVVVVPSYHASS